MTSLLTILIACAMALPANFEVSLDKRIGLSYFRAAEDLVADSALLDQNRKLAEELFVLSAVIDPALRNSAIIGLISIQEKSELIQSLRSLQLSSDSLLVVSVISPNILNLQEQSMNVKDICEILVKVRAGKKVTEGQLERLSPQRFLFPIEFDALISAAQSKRTNLSKELSKTSLQIELEVLGGASLWSADFVATSGMPVAIHVNDDLAALFNVNTEKLTLENGVWVK